MKFVKTIHTHPYNQTFTNVHITEILPTQHNRLIYNEPKPHETNRRKIKTNENNKTKCQI